MRQEKRPEAELTQSIKIIGTNNLALTARIVHDMIFYYTCPICQVSYFFSYCLASSPRYRRCFVLPKHFVLSPEKENATAETVVKEMEE